MVAPGKIRCRIVEIPVSSNRFNDRFSSNFSEMLPLVNERKPSELVPWADPYIAGLVTKLQREVRHERQVEWEATEVVDNRDISPGDIALISRELADFELDAADVFAPISVEAEWPWFQEDFKDGFENSSPDEKGSRDWDDGSGDVPVLF